MSDITAANQAPTRRDFLYVLTGAFGVTGVAAATWPLIAQMSPNLSTPRETVVVDLAPIKPGQAITVRWRNEPIFVRHRTRDEIVAARSVALADLPDALARAATAAAGAPATDENRTHASHPEWLVVVGLCTHLNCVLKSGDAGGSGTEAWFCPCHAARFDTSGRVRSGPARTNLPVPPYRFVAPLQIEIGRTS